MQYLKAVMTHATSHHGNGSTVSRMFADLEQGRSQVRGELQLELTAKSGIERHTRCPSPSQARGAARQLPECGPSGVQNEGIWNCIIPIAKIWLHPYMSWIKALLLKLPSYQSRPNHWFPSTTLNVPPRQDV